MKRVIFILMIFLCTACNLGSEAANNGIKCDDDYIEYFGDGNIKTVWNYYDCQLNGYVYKFYPFGGLSDRMYFKNGVQVDTTFSYYPNGSICNYSILKNGLPEGNFVKFYPNGDTMEIGQFYAGFKIETWSYYDTLGLVRYENFNDTIANTDSIVISDKELNDAIIKQFGTDE